MKSQHHHQHYFHDTLQNINHCHHRCHEQQQQPQHRIPKMCCPAATLRLRKSQTTIMTTTTSVILVMILMTIVNQIDLIHSASPPSFRLSSRDRIASSSRSSSVRSSSSSSASAPSESSPLTFDRIATASSNGDDDNVDGDDNSDNSDSKRMTGAVGGISSTDAGIVFPKEHLKNGELEAKLVSLANVSKAEDFFRVLGVSVPSSIANLPSASASGSSGAGTRTSGTGSSSSSSPSAVSPPHTFIDPSSGLPFPEDRTRVRPIRRQTFVNQAACEPEMRTIDLSDYTHTAVDPDVAVFPRCIRVPRCGGCCGPSDLLQCLPTKVTTRDVPRVLQKLTPSSKDSKNTIQETIRVDYHEKCACQCRVQEKDCDPTRHRYHRDKCKCMCINAKDQEECMADPDKDWNSSECTCLCRQVKRCSTGLRFSHETCACEIEGILK